MIYLANDRKFILHYQELKEDYNTYRRMTDAEFVTQDNLVKLLHFVCVVAYFKELGMECLVCDEGLIHQLVHLLNEETRESTLEELRDVRGLFDRLCELA